MAVNFPILHVPTIAEPCQQSWERMPGTARVRHCVACDQDVVNLAAMSSAEIAALLKGPIPCLRIARHDDGTLVTTEPPAAHSLPRFAAGLLSAALSVTAAAAQQTTPLTPPPPQQTREHPPQGVTLGAPLPARQTSTTSVPAKPPVPLPPHPHVTTGRVARPTPPPPPARPAPANVLMGIVTVRPESGNIPLTPAPLPPGKKSLPQK